jgi:hypothetical protein
MKESIDTLCAAFTELKEVLDKPVMQYAVLNSFLFKAFGRQALSSRLAQGNKALAEVRSFDYMLYELQTSSMCSHDEQRASCGSLQASHCCLRTSTL